MISGISFNSGTRPSESILSVFGRKVLAHIHSYLNILTDMVFIKKCTEYVKSGKLKLFMSKKLLLTALMVLPFTFRVFAPNENFIAVQNHDAVNPFKPLIYAIGRVENNGDTLAYNPVEEAAGFFQIRPVRLDDYNKRTGKNYTLADMFDYETSERVFLYYASKIGHYNFEKIAKNWNGSGPRTIEYWNRVKKYL